MGADLHKEEKTSEKKHITSKIKYFIFLITNLSKIHLFVLILLTIYWVLTAFG